MDEATHTIYTGMLLDGYFRTKSVKHKIANGNIPVIPVVFFERILAAWKEIDAGRSVLEADASEDRRFITSTLHEVRRLNAAIKAAAESALKALEQVDNLHEQDERAHSPHDHVLTAFHSASMVSMRLDAYDFSANPGRVAQDASEPIPVHRRFYKIKQCLVATSKAHARIALTGTCDLAVVGYDVFDMLPFVLLENALKFSPVDKDINVRFEQRNNRDLEVVVRSVGPRLEPGEIDRLTEEGFRGERARQLTGGDGIGLALARRICELHKISMSFHQRAIGLVRDEHELVEFTVRLRFDGSNLVSDPRGRFIEPR